MYLLALIAHIAVFAQAGVPTDKLDYAIITSANGATVGDCVWSLTHEPGLGSKDLVATKDRETRAFCRNPNTIRSNDCDAQKPGWKFEGCVHRFDAYYNKDHAPPYEQQWTNNFGECIYNPYGQDGGGVFKGRGICPCESVNVHGFRC